jgi:acetyl-CoA carboxylase biotin carboxyl carrier protein
MSDKDKDKDFQKIKKLIKIMKDNELVEIEIKNGNEKIHLKSSHPQSGQVVMPAVGTAGVSVPTTGVGAVAPGTAKPPEPEAKADDNLVEIRSPIVGTFYATGSPDSEPYVEAGTVVNPQTVVCIIEAMKVMNEIKAETSGTITAILVSSGQAVEYGQPLFKVKPD